jgi:hypothetical protein
LACLAIANITFLVARLQYRRSIGLAREDRILDLTDSLAKRQISNGHYPAHHDSPMECRLRGEILGASVRAELFRLAVRLVETEFLDTPSHNYEQLQFA